MRAFVGIDLPGGSDRAPDHLTLRFLGDIGPDRVAPIVRALAPVAGRFAPFEITLAGVGAFPSRRAPRVVWVDVTRGRDPLAALAEAVRAATRGEGTVAETERFVAHRTLFRVRSADDRRLAEELLSGSRPAPPPVAYAIRAFALKESRLGAGGAVHRSLATFPLSAGGGADGADRPTVH